MADKRISQLVERTDIANNDVLPIVASGATTTNKVTISTIQDWMQENLDVGVTSVGLSMPSAFTVSNSPVTTSGNISVTGAGTVSQYIRGDGSLADFPQSSGGGGASVSYYLNGSVSQGTIGGIAYREMNKTPVLGAGTDFTINANGYIASFITDAGDPSLLLIPGGNWNFETYFAASSGGGSPSFYVELYKVNSGGTATLIASNSANPELIAFGTTTTAYFSSLAVPPTTLTLTDRLALRYYVTHAGRTITLHTENSNLCQIITTFTTGLTALNGLTAQVQNFATGTSGSDFNISSASSTHTFNLPDASASNRGAVTTGSQVFGGVKTFANGLSLSAVGGSNQVTRLVNIGTLHEGSATLNQIGFNSANNIYFGKGLSNGGVLQWTNSAVRYYTFPDADGTLALASQLGAYLPLIGGTLTGALNGTSAVFSGDVQSGTRLIAAASSQSILLTPNSGGTTNRVESVGTLPLALVSAAAITMAAGGTTPQITLATGGGVTLTGALNGTSASFNTTNAITLTASDSRIRGGDTAGRLLLANSGTTTYGIFHGSSHATLPNAIQFYNDNTLSLSLASTGAATFSSSVTAGGNVLTPAGSGLAFTGDTSRIITPEDNVSGALIQTPGIIRFNAGGTSTRMTITAAGNVGIGTASPTANLHVSSGADTGIVINSSAGAYTGYLNIHSAGGGASVIRGIGGTPFLFEVNGSERMRITSGGYLKATSDGTYVASGSNFHELTATANGTDLLLLRHKGTDPYGSEVVFTGASPNNTSNWFFYASDATNSKFIVYSNGNVVNRNNSYGAISDIKLKENIQDATPKLDDLMKVKVRNYNLIGDDKKQIGVIAQELEEVFPAMIDESEDFEEVEVPQVDEEGNEILNEEGEVVTEKQRVSKGTTTKSVKYSVFVPMLIKAMQEQQEQIKELKTEIDSLKNQIK